MSEPIGWMDRVWIEGSDEPVFVTLLERRGHDVIVRQLDPSDTAVERIPIYEGDRPIIATAVSHAGINTTATVGDTSGFVVGVLVVPTARHGDTVTARVLGPDEVDDGRRVHVPPNGNLMLESIDIHIEHLDRPDGGGGPATPLAPILWRWFQLSDTPVQSTSKSRYLIAAARRLDLALGLFSDVDLLVAGMASWDAAAVAGPERTRQVLELAGKVELASVALSRAVEMAASCPTTLAGSPAVPSRLEEVRPGLTAIRNAYEHIEDRAFNLKGQRQKVVDTDALALFDFPALIADRRISYGEHKLGLSEQVPALLSITREYLKRVASVQPVRRSVGLPQD